MLIIQSLLSIRSRESNDFEAPVQNKSEKSHSKSNNEFTKRIK